MAEKYLIDSDYLIFFLNGREKAVSVLAKLKKKERFTSVICFGEVLEGIENKKIEIKFQKFFKTLSIINVDKEIMETFSDLRRYLRRKGNLIDNFDLVIAATCLTYNLVLITGNLSHFERIPKLKIYAE